MTFTNPTKTASYDVIITKLNEDLTKAQKEAARGLRWDKYEVCLRIKYVWRGEILEAYNRTCLKEKEDKVINFAHKSAK